MNDKLREFLWSKQREILSSVVENRRTAVKSCHGPGKSFTASRAALWWIDAHPPESAFVVTTAPSWPQVSAILWREMRRGHRKGGLRGRLTLDCEWHLGMSGKKGAADEDLVAYGRKPADYDETAFQGIHERFVLIIIDEACGVPKQLWDACSTLMTNDYARMLAIGNPDDPGAYFMDVCKSPEWNTIKIDAWSTPNFTGEYVPEEVAQSLVTPLWVEERRREWGVGSPMWVSKVEAEFPDVGDDTLFPPSIIEKAKQTDLAGFELGRYALDVARYGQDKSVLYRNRGGHIRRTKWWAKKDTVETYEMVTPFLDRHFPNRVPIVVDTIGLGAGPYDMLRHQGYDAVPFQGSEKPYQPDRFKNRRAEQYWTLRNMMEDGLIDLDPDDQELLAQLGSIKFKIMNGKVVVEDKEDMKTRGLPSPDMADTVMMATVSPTASVEELLGRRHGTLTGDLLDRVM